MAGGALPGRGKPREPLTAIMGALDVEVSAIRDSLKHPADHPTLGASIVAGSLDGHPVLLATSGVGKVNAAVTTTALAQAGATSLVFVGIAGAIAPDLKVGDAVIATDLIQHDVDLRAFGHPEGVIGGVKAGGAPDPTLSDRLVLACDAIGVTPHHCVIASGDQFIDSPQQASAIAAKFGAGAVEMEGAAVAQACHRLGLPFAVLRWISDTADHDAVADATVFGHQVAQLDLAVVRRFLAES